MEKKLNQSINNQTNKMITKVQKQYGTDIFGFSKGIHEKYPQKWKSMKKNWETEFAHAEIIVHSNLKIRRIGLTGQPLFKVMSLPDWGVYFLIASTKFKFSGS
nr:Ger(x)C family spore germination C-terminal domain-containing protein [Paenibacillus sp. Soil787]